MVDIMTYTMLNFQFEMTQEDTILNIPKGIGS